MLRAVLFDFNGVLVDDEPIHLELTRRVLREEGLTLSARDYFGGLVGVPDRACFRAALEHSGRRADERSLTALVERKAAYYRELMERPGIPVFPAAGPLLAALSAAGLRLGLVTGALRREVVPILERAGWLKAFEALVTAEDVAAGKPDPACYHLGLERLSSGRSSREPPLQPHEVAAIEDSANGLAAARGAGLVTIGVTHSFAAERLAAADLVVAGLGALTIERLSERFARATSR